MPVLLGASVVGRQVLAPNIPIADGRMSLTLLGEQQAIPRRYGHLSVELLSAPPDYFQMFDKALWVPGLYFTLEPRLLPASVTVAVYWKVAAIPWQLAWV